MSEHDIVIRYSHKTNFKVFWYKRISIILNIFLIGHIVKRWIFISYRNDDIITVVIGVIMLLNLLYGITESSDKHPAWKMHILDYSYLADNDQGSITKWSDLSIEDMMQYSNGWKKYMIHMVKLTIVYWVIVYALHFFAVWVVSNGWI